MKLKRLALCLLLSLAWVFTFTTVASFAHEGDAFTDFIQIAGTAEPIELDDEYEIEEEGIFKFVPSEDGLYAFGSYHDEDTDPDPVGRVLDAKGNVIAEDDDSDGDQDFKVVFSAHAGREYYLQAAHWEEDSVFCVYLEKSDIKGIEFIPRGQYEVWTSCDPEIQYWPAPDFQVGDKAIVKYVNGSSKVFTYDNYYDPDEDTYYYDFETAAGSALPGEFEIDMDSRYAPLNACKSGDAVTLKVNACYCGLRAQTTLNIKLMLDHEQYYDKDTENYYKVLNKTAGVPATYKSAGRADYWQCQYCGRYFKDKDGINEFANGEWIIPKLAPKTQNVAVNAKAISVKKNKLKKKAITVAPLTVRGAKGALSYKVVAGSAKSKKALQLNARNGKVTVKKKTKKGKYTIRVRVSASATPGGEYKPFARAVTVTVKVK